MKYRGYDIVKASHPTPFNPRRETYDIMDGNKVRKADISTLETAKKVIDTLVKYNCWPDRYKINETE